MKYPKDLQGGGCIGFPAPSFGCAIEPYKTAFQNNLKILTSKYTQKYIAECTGFSQSSINNYLTKNSEPSIQFLVALKNAFGICLDDFLFSDIDLSNEVSYDSEDLTARDLSFNAEAMREIVDGDEI